ncbi:MAG: DUF1778 domain-containing protein [Xenococcaceae cyanobacterium MO_188.B19]|nr:DUF1778 domain-containing protein [Xenococcaceae cyanobacterium MO_188.B19]
MATTHKQKVINLRIDESRKNLIDEAARLQGKSCTEFMIETSYKEAERTILDQTLYILDEVDYEYLFCTDHKPDPKLVKLFRNKSFWEK